MFRLREVNDHVFTIERAAHNGLYCVTLRAGLTVMAKLRYDNGREAWSAYRSSPERFMESAR